MSSLERSPYNNMVDTDAEIEFLDEDADIVQQCVQSTIVPEEEDKEYLVERAPERPKRRRKVEDEDSDYDPRDEVPSPVPKMKKKKHARKPEKVNTIHGNSETAIWSKTSVENENGVRKSQIFQSILPRYREKKILDSYELQNIKVPRNCHHVDEVLLTKEESKNGDILVAYKPKEAITSVYKFTDDGDNESESADVEARKCLREVACCRTCAPCYQTSWRATRRDNAKMKIRCPVCGRGWPSAYSLLTHLRSHPGPQLQRHRAAVHHELARILDYHYRCRVCQHTFTSIKCLRAHVASHKGTETFTCEIGNHVAS
ncbi:zinc finger and BTB domain-containing protein 24-like isoform X2 [Galleria mellonella]|uniref:Zinc finger and BTB domain-containing protein 24-like isoform X2 n=1 Tax=Galleria mellonella TaxID=7137 RepID=A0ABM3MDN3_GALME|nr:zinc finger and BTB domain-containing protein 24-like isoform X2 [Galleria mellonella]